ncbi:MAG: hypothetical protein K0S45_2872 [Nitrospira sp.]|jgi:hypothetical protein|nr:hypothetical protein [Nitrospira sp.]
MSVMPETVIPVADLNRRPTTGMGDDGRAFSRGRPSRRKVGNLTCNEGEVEDLLSEGETT